jgi:hypothetical protein
MRECVRELEVGKDSSDPGNVTQKS